MLNLGNEAEIIRVYEADTIAGNATDESDQVDMSGGEAVCFIVAAGTLGAAGLTVRAHQSDDEFVADDDELDGSEIVLAVADSDLLAVIDLGKPEKQYIRVEMEAGADDCDIDDVIAIKYRLRDLPATEDATVAETVVLITPDAV